MRPARVLLVWVATAAALAQSESWEAHHSAVRKALDQKQLEVAEKEARAGLDAVAKAGPSDPRYIRSLMDQAEVESRRNVARSEMTLWRALESAEQSGAMTRDAALNDDLRRALLNRMGTLVGQAWRADNIGEALFENRRALGQLSKLNSPQPRETVTTFNYLGLILMRDGRYKAASSAFERGLAVQQDALLLSNLADLRTRVGRYAEAEAALLDAINLDASAKKGSSPSSVGFQRSLQFAILNVELGNYDSAESVLRQAEESFKGSLIVQDVQHVLGNIDCARGRFESALSHFGQALASNRELYPNREENLARGELISDMGRCATAQRDFTSAEGYFTEATAILEKLLRPGHPSLGLILRRRASLLEAQKKTAEAEPLLTRAIGLLESGAGSDAPILVPALEELARLRKALGRPAAAQEALARAGVIKAKWQKPAALAVKPLAVAEAAELAYWDSLDDRDDPAAYRQYLRDFPGGKFAAAAGTRGAEKPSSGLPCPQDFVGVSGGDLALCVSRWKDAGYAPIALAAYQENGVRYFAGAFQKGEPRLVTPQLTRDEFETDLELYRSRGQRPTSIAFLADPENPRFTVTWTRLDPNAKLLYGPLTEAGWTDVSANQSKNLVNSLLFVYRNPEPSYVTVWEPAPPGMETRSFVDLSGRQMTDNSDSLSKQGYRPVHCQAYPGPSGVRWAEVWIKQGGHWYIYRGQSKAQYLALRDEMLLRGLSLADLSILENRFTAIWIKR